MPNVQANRRAEGASGLSDGLGGMGSLD